MVTTAFIKKTVQQLSQKPEILRLNTLVTLFFLDINLNADTIPFLTTLGCGGGLINRLNSKVIR